MEPKKDSSSSGPDISFNTLTCVYETEKESDKRAVKVVGEKDSRTENNSDWRKYYKEIYRSGKL